MRGGCCGPGDLPRAARTLPGQRERQTGPSGAKMLIQTSDRGARPASSRSGPPQTPGRCAWKAEPRGHTARHTKLSAFTRGSTQRNTLRTTSAQRFVRETRMPRPGAAARRPPGTTCTGRRAAGPSPGSVTEQLPQGRAAAIPSPVAKPRAGWRPSVLGAPEAGVDGEVAIRGRGSHSGRTPRGNRVPQPREPWH